MNRRPFFLFRLSETPYYADRSCALAALVGVAMLAMTFFPRTMASSPRWMYWSLAVAAVGGLGLSALLREIVSSQVAKFTHAPLRSVTLFPIGAVSETAHAPSRLQRDRLRALVGPLTSGLLGASFFVFVAWSRTHAPQFVTQLAAFLAVANCAYAFVQCLPAYPLDGGRFLRGEMWRASGDFLGATSLACLCGKFVAWAFLALGALVFVFGATFLGIFLLVLGWSLRLAAQQSLRQEFLREALRGEPVVRFANSDVPVLVPDRSLQEVLDEGRACAANGLAPVVVEGRVVGCLRYPALRAVRAAECSRKTVGQIMEQLSPQNSIAADRDAREAVRRMGENGADALLVVAGDRCVGVVTWRELFRRLPVRLDRKAPPDLQAA